MLPDEISDEFTRIMRGKGKLRIEIDMVRMDLKGRKFFENIKNNHIYFYVALIITVVFAVVWIVESIYPFGENSIIILDGVHQYIPFFSEYYEKIKNGDSLLYSFHVGMGNNFFSLFSYYLSSPLNLLILFFSKEKIYFSLSLLVYLKILLAGLSFAYYLLHRPEETGEKNVEDLKLNKRREKELHIVGFSLAYALSSYCTGYYWNVMWLDCIYILPLVILGVERLIKEKKIGLYVITLAYCLYCNYYIGFMVCLFLVLFFFTFKPSSIKEFVLNGLRFAVSSLLGGGISAALLLPTYWGIMMTSSGETIISKIPEWKWYGSLKEILVSQLAFNVPVTISSTSTSTEANLYCSVIVLLLLPMFLFLRKTSLHRRLTIIAIILFFYVSYDNELLNYIWHGFHAPYGIPNRMVFLCNFLLLVVGYEVTKEREEIPWHGYGVGLTSSLGFILYLWINNKTENFAIFTSSLLLVVLYGILFLGVKAKKIESKAFCRFLTIILSMEVGLFGIVGILECGTSSGDKYFAKNEDFEDAKVSSQRALQDGFYRTELNIVQYINEAVYHNLNDISLFGSTADAGMTEILDKLGFAVGINAYLYQGATQFTDSIFAVHYTILREDYYVSNKVSVAKDISLFQTYGSADEIKTSTGAYIPSTFAEIKDLKTVRLYQNNYPLSLGFKVSSDIFSFNKEKGNVFEVQNKLAEKMTCVESEIFSKVNGKSTVKSSNNLELVKKGSTQYSYQKSNDEATEIMMQIPMEEDMQLYVYPMGNDITDVIVCLDSQIVACGNVSFQCIYLGDVKEGQMLTVKFKTGANGTVSGYVGVELAKYNEENFKKHYEVLSKNQLSVKQLDANILECTSKDKDGGLYFTSIPYDDGFEITVDGKKQDAKILADAFLGFELEPLKEGQKEHKIVIKFVPVGLKEGIIISISSACIFILILCLQRVWNKKKEEHVSGSDMGISDEVSS